MSPETGPECVSALLVKQCFYPRPSWPLALCSSLPVKLCWRCKLALDVLLCFYCQLTRCTCLRAFTF